MNFESLRAAETSFRNEMKFDDKPESEILTRKMGSELMFCQVTRLCCRVSRNVLLFPAPYEVNIYVDETLEN